MQLRSMRESAQTITGNALPSVEVINVLNADLVRARLLELRHVNNDEPAYMADVEKQFEQLQQRLGEEKKVYEPLIVADEEKQLYKQFLQDRARYVELNKQQFQLDVRQDVESAESLSGGRSNTNYIEHRLKDKAFKNCQKFTDSDEEFIDALGKMIARGTIAKKTAQSVRKELERTLDPLEVIAILRKHIRVVDTPETAVNTTASSKREVILSGYQIAKQQ